MFRDGDVGADCIRPSTIMDDSWSRKDLVYDPGSETNWHERADAVRPYVIMEES